MKTIKRMPVDIKVSGLSNMNKYFNQMQFNGIKEDDNIYAIDQMSLRDAKNVYIDDNLRLVSRPTLQYSDLPPEIPAFSELVDIKDFGSGKVYITKSVLNKYSVIIVPNTPVIPIAGATFIIEELTNYHIATIEHYVICFNNVNAKIFDTNNADQGWQNLTNYAEVPVVKRVVGETITTYDKNYFIPDLYKEEYIWSNESKPLLPTGNGNVVVNTSLGKFPLTLNDTNQLTDYRATRPINYRVPDTPGDPPLVSAAKDRVCIGYSKYSMVSYNKGATFRKVYYPEYSGDFLHIAEISKDGNYFFFVGRSGIYRCNLADLTWAPVFKGDDGTGQPGGIKGYSIAYTNNFNCCFLTGHIFSFVTKDDTDAYLYFKGPGLFKGDDYTNDHMNPSNADYYIVSYITRIWTYGSTASQNNPLLPLFENQQTTTYRDKQFVMTTTTDLNGKTVATINITITHSKYVGTQPYTDVIFVYGGNTSSIGNRGAAMHTRGYILNSTVQYIQDSAPRIYGVELLDITYNKDTLDATVNCIVDKDTDDYTHRGVLTFTRAGQNMYAYTDIAEIPYTFGNDNTRLPLLMKDVYITLNSAIGIGFIVDDNIYYNDRQLSNLSSRNLAITDEYYYVFVSDTIVANTGFGIWTNAFLDNDTISITYTIGSAGNFTQVPTVSYTDTELYLAFDNLLQITYNTKDPDDPTKTLFYLPKINNQSFIDKITAMINISTTEIAIFFLNKIIICSKVADENLVQGFRYDYYNTKLSTGVRLGDSVINTLEGSFTLFPTLRGLAAMNYQAFMATSDQTISYITDTVKNMWTKFYNDSEQIRIIQWRNRLVLTNGTGTILLYDLTAQAWWRWELSRDVLVALSNQLDLQVINGTLLTFKENVDQYYDFGERGEFNEIDWYIMSQPLHFNAPNYYKNIKQLVFQMSETEDEKSTKTMDAQIKLYRKKITIREPETVKFKIEELRTFVKRFNYWKINELQWGISNDTETSTPKRLELNGMSVKYEIGEEVR